MAKAHIFISYAHEDKEWVLEGPGNIHLIPRIRRHTSPDAEIWFDEGLVIGEKWDEEIHNHIVQSHIAILLISESFVSSDYIVNKELVWIKEQVEKNDMKIVPLLIGNITEKSKRIIDCAHLPVGVAQGVRFGHGRQFFPAFPEERPAGAGQDQALDLPLVPAAHQALENGRMLRVDGDDLRAGCARRGLHELPGADHGLFVGKGDALVLVDGRERRPQGGKAAHRCDDGIGLRQRRSLTQRLAAREHPYIHIRKTGL